MAHTSQTLNVAIAGLGVASNQILPAMVGTPDVQEIARRIASGDLGHLAAINIWSFTDWMLRARMPQEVDPKLGGGVVYRQGPHQVDTARLLGGGMVRSVRAMAGEWMPERHC